MSKKLPNVFLRTASVLLLAPLVMLVIYCGSVFFNLFLSCVTAIMLYEAVIIYRNNAKPYSHKKLTICILMSAYICCAMYFLYGIRYSTHGFEILTWMVLSVWMCDICAYITGNLVKGPKILPSISPNKTWSGFFGGAIGAIGFAFIYQKAIGLYGYPLVQWSLLVGAVAHVGDFVESYYKRQFNVKDSGNIIPGHGGLLDRFDSMIAVACFVVLLKGF